ncbi:hypothetical protein ABZ847_29325, partial [Streptomyces bauhiniae]
ALCRGVTIEELEEEAGGSRAGMDADFLVARLKEDANAAYDKREEQLGTEGVRQLERMVLLQVIDRKCRDAEIRDLTAERDALRERVGEGSELDKLRAEVAALREAAARSGVGRSGRWTMSAGVAADLETTGYATDPNTGDAYVRDGDQVKVTSRSGATRTILMPGPSGAGERESLADPKS